MISFLNKEIYFSVNKVGAKMSTKSGEFSNRTLIEEATDC